MPGRYRSYAEYKDTGVIGLNKIPLEWHVQRVKFLFRLGRGRVISQEELVSEGKYPVYSSQTKDNGCLGHINSFDFDCTQITWTTDGANAGTVFLREGKHNCTNVCGTLQPKNKSNNLKYFLYCLQYVTQFYKRPDTNGAKIMNGEMGEIFVSVPTRYEQDIICFFLDHEITKIDVLIEKQKKLIHLLKEKRQAVISHAVTKGCNPNIKMRDSGVDWLGVVPEGWKVTRAKFLFDFVTSGSRGWADFYSDEGSLFFRITNLTRDTIEPKMESIQNVTPPLGSEGERSKINKNDLLISITADLGSVCVANDEVAGGYVSQHVALCRPNANVASSRWLGYFVLSDIAKEQFTGSAYGGTKIQLSLEDIRELWVVQPRGEDQVEISTYIDKQLATFAEIMSFAKDQISLLQERRTALIFAAVTGEIDVRNWVAPQTGHTNKEVAA